MVNKRPVVEELPLSPVAQERVAQVAATPYKGQLRKLGGLSLFEDVRAGNITLAEHDIIRGELAAREKILSVSPDQLPMEVPDSPATLGLTQSAAEWSPTAILATLPPADAREFDARERAAGEYLDR